MPWKRTRPASTSPGNTVWLAPGVLMAALGGRVSESSLNHITYKGS